MVTRAHGRTITDGSIDTADLADGAVTAAKLSAADTAGSRAAIQAAGTEVSNTFYGSQQIRSTDPAATEGPLLTLERITEPAEAASAADLIGGLALRGLDSAAAQVLYGKIAGRIDDPTAASEDFAWLFATRIAGALATRFLMGAGLYAQGLSDMGAGTVNAAGLYVNGSPVGRIVQVVNTQTGAVATGSTVIPFDDTIPQNTEGDEYMTRSITPTSATNKLRIDVTFNCAVSALAQVVVALYQDSTANALAAITASRIEAAGVQTTTTLTHYMTAGTTSATTFKVRAGPSTGTLTFNGSAGARRFGGVMASSITITEIVP